MPRFYCSGPVLPDTTFALPADVAQHVRVLRLREGDHIVLFDGAGGETAASIRAIGKREIEVSTGAHTAVEREARHQITLLAALIANDRMDWMIQKATELGVAAIQPVYTERSQRIPGDVNKRVEHWRGVVIAACEQCGRNRLPTVAAPLPLTEAVVGVASTQPFILLDAEGDAPAAPAVSACTVVVGPEGGFSAAELATLRQRCTHRVRIGATVLRAETAAIAALARLA